jgi:hypothetical protein
MAEPVHRARVILHPDVTDEQIEDVAMDLDWMELGIKPATEKTPYQRIWEDEIAKVVVRYIWDDLLRQPFLTLQGEDVSTVEQRICNALPSFTPEEIVESLHSASGYEPVIDAIALVALLGHAGYGELSEDPEIVRLLEMRAQSEHPEVRNAVITAAGYLEWPAMLELVAGLRDRDPDQDVREQADLVLNAIAEARAQGHDRPDSWPPDFGREG